MAQTKKSLNEEDNLSDKYMNLEENAVRENQAEGGKTRPDTEDEHQTTDLGVTYALPDKVKDGKNLTPNKTENVRHTRAQGGAEYTLPIRSHSQDEYSQLDSAKYMSFDEMGNAKTNDLQNGTQPVSNQCKEANFRTGQIDDDNMSDKYMPLEESTANENNIKQGKNTTGAIVKHKIAESGVAYTLPDKERSKDSQDEDEYQNGDNYMELNETVQEGTGNQKCSIPRHHFNNIESNTMTGQIDEDNISDKYMPLDENNANKNFIKEGKSSTGAIVKHQIVESGAK